MATFATIMEALYDRLGLTAETDLVVRLANQAKNSLEKLIVLGRDTQQKVRETLTEGIALMHP